MQKILQTKKTIKFLNATPKYTSPDPKNKIDPIYNLVIAKEGHSPLKNIDHLNKRFGKPALSSEDFIKFSRNSYLIKVTKVDQGFCLQSKKYFKNSGIIKIVPYDEYNGSWAKFTTVI